LVLLILAASDIALTLLGARDIILRSLLHNIAVRFLIVLKVGFPFLGILKIFSLLNGSLIWTGRLLMRRSMVFNIGFIIVD
jgi:hypothetical protein